MMLQEQLLPAKAQIRKGTYFELRYFLVLVKKTLRSPSFLITLIFSTLLYVALPLIQIEAFSTAIQPSVILNFMKEKVNVTQEISDAIYTGTFYQVQIWSAFIRPFAIIAPASLLINKTIIQPFKTGSLLLYIGTPIRKSSLLTISLLFTLLLSSLIIITIDTVNTASSLALFRKNLSGASVEASANLNDFLKVALGLPPGASVPADALTSTAPDEINAFTAQNYLNNVYALLPKSLDKVADTTWNSLPYSLGMLFMYSLFTMPLSFIIGFKSRSKFAAAFPIFLISGSAVMYWAVIMPLARIDIGEETLLSIFQVLSYLCLGMYPSTIVAASFEYGGYKSSGIQQLSIIQNSKFDIIGTKLLPSEVSTAIVNGNLEQSAQSYLPFANMLGIMGACIILFLAFSIWLWRKEDVK